MTLDEVLGQVEADLTARMGGTRARAEAIRAALDAYVSSHAALLAAEFAEKNGLTAPSLIADAAAAARRLSELVASLPELGASAGADRADRAEPASARSAVRFETMDIPTLEEAERTLSKEFDAAPFAGMRLGEFMLYAEEFAAAARALQERSGGDPLSQRVIRKLTAFAHERDLAKKIFGLSRSHTGDWQRLANEARARRLGGAKSGSGTVA